MAVVTCGNCHGRKTVIRLGKKITCGTCNGRGTVDR